MSNSLFPNMLPGVLPGRTTTNRVVFRQRDESYLAQGVKIDGPNSRDPSNTVDPTTLQSGLLMGRCTGSTGDVTAPTVNNFAPSIIGTIGVIVAGATSMTVSLTVAAEIVRRFGATGTFKLTGPPVANGVVATEVVTYSAVSLTTGVITCTATANAYVAGSFVQPQDGSETPLSFIDDLRSVGGINVVDQNGASVTVVDWPLVPVTGMIHSAALINWPTDTSLQAWIVARLNDSSGNQYNFDHHLLGSAA